MDTAFCSDLVSPSDIPNYTALTAPSKCMQDKRLLWNVARNLFSKPLLSDFHPTKISRPWEQKQGLQLPKSSKNHSFFAPPPHLCPLLALPSFSCVFSNMSTPLHLLPSPCQVLLLSPADPGMGAPVLILPHSSHEQCQKG